MIPGGRYKPQSSKPELSLPFGPVVHDGFYPLSKTVLNCFIVIEGALLNDNDRFLQQILPLV